MRKLLLAAVASLLATGAFAQTQTDFFTGAIPKTQVAQLGTAPAVTTVAASGATQALAFPAYGSVAYDVTLTANCTFTLTGGTAGQRQTISLLVRNPTGGFTITLPGGLKWSNAATPTFVTTAGTMTDITFSTTDGGVTYVAK